MSRAVVICAVMFFGLTTATDWRCKCIEYRRPRDDQSFAQDRCRLVFRRHGHLPYRDGHCRPGADSYGVWVTNPDGSLVHNDTTDPNYSYINPGSTNYPTLFGGDGINHYAGGGGNYDLVGHAFGPAGATSTDTTDPSTIRLGALIGTFSSSPGRLDWFVIGFGTTLISPSSTDHLYLAVEDTFYPNNLGAYSVNISTSSVPEPSTIAMTGLGGLITFVGFYCRRRQFARGKYPLESSSS